MEPTEPQDPYGAYPAFGPNEQAAYPPPAGPYAGGYGGYYPPPAAPPAWQSPRRGRRGAALAAGAVALAVAVSGVAYTVGHDTVRGTGSAQSQSPASGGVDPGFPFGNGSGNPGTSGSNGTTSLTTASAAQSIGIVDVDTVLGYEQAKAAGTGMILTSSGEVLTNNHVVEGATQVTVTVVSTGRTYNATVVGTDPTADVAVIQMSGASGLQTANLGNSTSVHTGAQVTGVGNAGGVGGTPSAATGQVVALNQQLTASDDNGDNPEQLTGMIETNAPIEAGDSGGPLYNSSNKVIGIDTAAATTGRATVDGYAIPINTALSVAAQIESGQATTTITIGYPGFLGVDVADTSGGALVEQVVAKPAADAGIGAGDVITSVNGTAVTSSASLKTALSGHGPGSNVTIGWTDTTGATHSSSVALITGPAN